MDGRTAGLAGGIAGAVIGLMGGVIGTYFSIKNTEGPRERAFMIRLSILGWIGITAFLAVLFIAADALEGGPLDHLRSGLDVVHTMGKQSTSPDPRRGTSRGDRDGELNLCEPIATP